MVVDNFTREYFNKEKINDSKVNQLKNYMNGRVSFLRSMKSEVSKNFIGKKVLNYFNLYQVKLSKYQEDVYLKAAENTAGFDSQTRQASLMVFPNDTWGQVGYKNFVSENDGRYFFKDYINKKDNNTLYNMINILRTGSTDVEDKDKHLVYLNNLQNYSAKYAQCIKLILAQKRSNHFVYNEFVGGSGATVFAIILRDVFGMKQYSGKTNESEPANYNTFALITGSSEASQIKKIINLQNRPENWDGKYLRVIIGSEIISEGITLKNILSVHVLTPHWNFSLTDQVIGRAVRFNSHREVIENNGGNNVNVNIYLYCIRGTKIQTIDNNIDLKMYNLSEIKDKQIKQVERIIIESSVDCQLTKARNMLPNDLDNTRECNYTTCYYRCDGITDENINFGGTSLATYNLYYNNMEKQQIKNKIIEILKINTSIKIGEIIKLFPESSYYSILDSITELQEKFVVIKDKFGFDCLIRVDNDIVYLTYSLSTKTNFFDNYYLKNLALHEYNNFDASMVESTVCNTIKSLTKRKM